MCDIKEETVSYFIKEAETARKDYNNRIKNLTNKFFKDNHIPLKVGDRVMIANGKVGTIVSLHTEVYKDFRYYNVPMVRVELDENKDLEYVAALISIKKI
nr:MAG TPA: CarS [Crassvirales sp.]